MKYLNYSEDDIKEKIELYKEKMLKINILINILENRICCKKCIYLNSINYCEHQSNRFPYDKFKVEQPTSIVLCSYYDGNQDNKNYIDSDYK